MHSSSLGGCVIAARLAWEVKDKNEPGSKHQDDGTEVEPGKRGQQFKQLIMRLISAYLCFSRIPRYHGWTSEAYDERCGCRRLGYAGSGALALM